jgi:hypothetical protein
MKIFRTVIRIMGPLFNSKIKISQLVIHISLIMNQMFQVALLTKKIIKIKKFMKNKKNKKMTQYLIIHKKYCILVVKIKK